MNLSVHHHCFTPRSVGTQRYIAAHRGIMHFNNSIGVQMSKIKDHGSLCMIADGMSGLKNDRLAVELAILIFRQLYMLSAPEFNVEHLKQFVEQGHQEIRTSINQRNLPLMGCSFSLLWFYQGQIMWLSIGNSSIYQYRDGKAYKISSEHSVAEFVQRDWMQGEPTSKLAQGWLFGSKIPNQAQHIFLTEGYDFGTISMVPGDRFLLVNKGFDEQCSEEQRHEIIEAPSFSPFPLMRKEQECCLVLAQIEG